MIMTAQRMGLNIARTTSDKSIPQDSVPGRISQNLLSLFLLLKVF